MCMYCERRQDVKFGWEQPKLPYHNQKDISAILTGNVLENEKWDGIGTIYIPIKYCPECGRRLGKE